MITKTNYTFDPRPFTYDSNVVPNSPSIGNTWRERDSSNGIVDEWEWSGAIWYSREVITDSYSQTPITGFLTGPSYQSIKDVFLIDYTISFKVFGAVHDISNYNTLSVQFLSQASGQGSSVNTYQLGNTIGIPTNTPTQLLLVRNSAYYIPTQISLFVGAVGSPSNLNSLTGTSRYRKIRP